MGDKQLATRRSHRDIQIANEDRREFSWYEGFVEYKQDNEPEAGEYGENVINGSIVIFHRLIDRWNDTRDYICRKETQVIFRFAYIA